MIQAARLSNDGELYLRLAEVYVEAERWDDARKALKSALSKGQLDDPGQAHLLHGVALFHAKRSEESKRAFRAASKHVDQRRSTNAWLVHLQRQD